MKRRFAISDGPSPTRKPDIPFWILAVVALAGLALTLV